MQTGGIILCGGHSSRMGLPKATLPFGPELMLQRVVRILREVVSPVVVVRAAGQTLPALPEDVLVTADRHASRGPLEGLQAGLLAIRPFVESAFVSACDAPLLKPEFVRAVVARRGAYDIAVPVRGSFHYPLAAAYATDITATIQSQLDAGQFRTQALFGLVKTLRVPCDQLTPSDQGLESLRNVNRADDYFAALASAGFDVPSAIRRQLVDQDAAS